ncbi:MAG: hypothetical protein ACYC33_05820 [Thermoleophilia bacterium]
MRAAVFAAFPDDGGGVPVAPQRDRQLHLVFEAEGGPSDPPVEEIAAFERGDMVATVVGSLAEYALGLRAGDRCFCCGRPLEVSAPVGAETSGRSLQCVECGAWVLGPE